ncbi:MAG TPA: methyltransferase [Gammaproteobacteria bacterium]|nr:methyltransferase [Gammaproteobacteria bacterium]
MADIKTKIINFDIKPAKSDLAERLVAIDKAVEAGDYPLAEKLLLKVVARYRSNVDALIRLADVYGEQGKSREAVTLLQYAVKQHPTHYDLHRMLGYSLRHQGKVRAASKVYKRLLEIRADESVAYFCDVLLKKNVPCPPSGYITELFNGYAELFEAHLVGILGYQAPKKLASYLSKIFPVDKSFATVLDLGCGTGLLGEELLQYFKINHLAGVDLSKGMLEQCSAKKIYHALHNQSLIEYLQQTTAEIELIVSTDTLIYIGDLEAVIANSYRLLAPGGILAFTVEKGWWGTYKLTTTGRYKHSMRYLKSLYKRYLFSKMFSQTIDLREEVGKMVPGYLVLLQK